MKINIQNETIKRLLKRASLCVFKELPEKTIETVETLTTIKSEREKPEWVSKWDQMVEQNPAGTKFDYLGIEMVITQILPAFSLNFSGSMYYMERDVKCEYVDKLGVIHEKTFQPHQIIKIPKP